METVYGSRDDVHVGGGTLSERVQSLASSIYQEFEVMMKTYGDGVIKNLMPQVVTILESLNQAYREKQEHEVELELLHVENDNLKVQFEREKQLRKTNEQRCIETEDSIDEERKTWSQKTQSLEIDLRKVEIKLRNMQEHVLRQDERESELRDDNSKLHVKYSELFRTHVDYVERTKPSSAESTPWRKQTTAVQTSVNTSIVSSEGCVETASKQNVSASSSMEETIAVHCRDSNDVPDDLSATDDGVDRLSAEPRSSQSVCGECRQLSVDEAMTHSDDIISSQFPLQLSVVRTELSPSQPDDASRLFSLQDEHCVVTDELDVSPALPATDVSISAGDSVSERTRECDVDVDDGGLETQAVDVRIDDTVYHDCINASFVTAEFDDVCVSLAEDDGAMGDASPSGRPNMSVYDELSTYSAAMLGEVDSGSDLVVAGVSTAVDNLIIENNELLATKNALNIVKDDLIAKVDELTGEIDLLQEENSQLQKIIDEKSSKVVVVEEELKKARECKVENESHFTRIDLMRVLMERNQFKERLIELQDAVRRADMARAAAKDQVASQTGKKRSSVWGFFGNLVGSDATSDSSSWSHTDQPSDSTVI